MKSSKLALVTGSGLVVGLLKKSFPKTFCWGCEAVALGGCGLLVSVLFVGCYCFMGSCGLGFGLGWDGVGLGLWVVLTVVGLSGVWIFGYSFFRDL